MAESADLIDFEIIETQKENIQSLPGGRSAKQLSLLCSPLAAKESPPLTQTQELKNTIRQDFEKELQTIDEADDPLEIFDRYIKWSLNAYPTAQATAESGLLPLVERATKAFITSDIYKNDPRYLKIWLQYIRLFSDSPRETYAFIAKHNIGEGLALFYEEFAAWLETQGRWNQAEEVYLMGVDKEARPKERLLRKYAEFQHRRDLKSQGTDGPASPALPRVRPALMAKADMFAGSEEQDPQAGDRAAAQAGAARAAKPGRTKLAIFADEDGSASQSSGNSAAAAPGWESIGSLNERKKENIREAKPWAGETLDGGKVLAGPKMLVFKDPVSQRTLTTPSSFPASYGE
jgi:checkpoint serine/threonine-protein kinase